MFGLLLSGVVKVVTLPLDIVESTADVLTGGDGSCKEMDRADIPRLSKARDKMCDVIEKIDK